MCKNKSYYNEIDCFVKWLPVTKNYNSRYSETVNTCWYEETAWERGWLDDPLVSNTVMLCTAYIVITLQIIWTVGHWAFCTYTLYCPRDNIQLRKFCNSIGEIFEVTLLILIQAITWIFNRTWISEESTFSHWFQYLFNSITRLTETFFRISASFWWCYLWFHIFFTYSSSIPCKY